MNEKEEVKWEITIDAMMIIGKYFKTTNDFVGVMKVCKRYHDLVQMYHFNPISDCELFENMETQHLYNEKDKLREGIKRHVYLYPVDYEKFKNRKDSDEYKRVELKKKKVNNESVFPFPVEKGNCSVPQGVTSIG